jgi:hypothetical protein
MITCKIVAYLFSLAVGYWVLTLADKEKNLNKKIGKWIGWIVIVVSICGMLCSASFCMKCCSKSGCGPSTWGCPMGATGKMGCPGKMGGPGKMGDQGMMEDKAQTDQK